MRQEFKVKDGWKNFKNDVLGRTNGDRRGSGSGRRTAGPENKMKEDAAKEIIE